MKSQDPWQSWKNKTKAEKDAINLIKKARKLILESVPKKSLIAIYIKGSFARREMKKDSDIDIVPILTEMKYQAPVFAVNSMGVYPCIVVPLSLPEFKKNKLLSPSNRIPDDRAKPDRLLRNLENCMLIYGKAINPGKYPIRTDKEALKDEVKVIKESYIVHYKNKKIPFNPLLKEVFWLTELEQNIKGAQPKHSFKEIADSVKDKNHIIHDAYELRSKPNKAKEKAFIVKLRKHLTNLEKKLK